MNVEEEKSIWARFWSKLAMSLFLEAENEFTDSGVQPAAGRAKYVMRWERDTHTELMVCSHQ